MRKAPAIALHGQERDEVGAVVELADVGPGRGPAFAVDLEDPAAAALAHKGDGVVERAEAGAGGGAKAEVAQGGLAELAVAFEPIAERAAADDVEAVAAQLILPRAVAEAFEQDEPFVAGVGDPGELALPVVDARDEPRHDVVGAAIGDGDAHVVAGADQSQYMSPRSCVSPMPRMRIARCAGFSLRGAFRCAGFPLRGLSAARGLLGGSRAGSCRHDDPSGGARSGGPDAALRRKCHMRPPGRAVGRGFMGIRFVLETPGDAVPQRERALAVDLDGEVVRGGEAGDVAAIGVDVVAIGVIEDDEGAVGGRARAPPRRSARSTSSSPACTRYGNESTA